MASLKAFLKENKVEKEPRKVFITDSFVDDKGKAILWEIRGIGSEEEKAISDSVVTEKRDRQTGTISQFRDDAEYMARIAAAGVVFPDLSDRDLQTSYTDRKGHPCTSKVSLLRAMLTVGELVSLAQEVIKESGLDIDGVEVSTMESDVEYAKN